MLTVKVYVWVTVMAPLVPVWPPPSFAVIVIDPDADNVTDALVQTPLDQPLVPVLVGLIVPEEAAKPTLLPKVVTVFS